MCLAVPPPPGSVPISSLSSLTIAGGAIFSCYGSPVTNKLGQPITPNLDRLASQGIRFTQGYVAYPICSPSRTAVLTGIEPARYALYSYLDNKSPERRPQHGGLGAAGHRHRAAAVPARRLQDRPVRQVAHGQRARRE